MKINGELGGVECNTRLWVINSKSVAPKAIVTENDSTQ